MVVYVLESCQSNSFRTENLLTVAAYGQSLHNKSQPSSQSSSDDTPILALDHLDSDLAGSETVEDCSFQTLLQPGSPALWY